MAVASLQLPQGLRLILSVPAHSELLPSSARPLGGTLKEELSTQKVGWGDKAEKEGQESSPQQGQLQAAAPGREGGGCKQKC